MFKKTPEGDGMEYKNNVVPFKAEQKTFEIKLKALNEKGEFEGYASVFNVVDFGNDNIMPGAFKKTLEKNGGKVPILDIHDKTVQIGWNVEAVEDNIGLKVKGKINLEVQAGRERYALAKQAIDLGVPMGLSIGYIAREWSFEGDVRILKEVDLFEYSFVPFPMNPLAQVVGMKNADFDNFVEAKLVEETDVQVGIRLLSPANFNQKNFKKITLKDSSPQVFAIVNSLKGEKENSIQSLCFPKKDNWTKDNALKWAKDYNFEFTKASGFDIEKLYTEGMELKHIPEIFFESPKNLEKSLREAGFSKTMATTLGAKFASDFKLREADELQKKEIIVELENLIDSLKN